MRENVQIFEKSIEIQLNKTEVHNLIIITWVIWTSQNVADVLRTNRSLDDFLRTSRSLDDDLRLSTCHRDTAREKDVKSRISHDDTARQTRGVGVGLGCAFMKYITM